VAAASIVLEPRPASVGEARRWLAEQLASWGLYGLDYDVSVVLSELVTNAVLHGRTEFTVRVSFEDDSVRLEVEDGNPHEPVTRHRSARATTGRGLVLVEALSSAWGCVRTETGKTIWARFDDVEAFSGGEVTELRSGAARPAGTTARSSKRGSGPRLVGGRDTSHPVAARRSA
jgi:anti-sigma regulatory factor (Ser/Thr protein kinase)